MKTLTMFACAALALGCATPDTAESTDTAQEALVTVLDPTAIKTAITGGATYDDDAEAIRVSGVANYPQHDGSAWSLAPGGDHLMHKRSFELIRDGEISVNPETGDKLVASSGMYFQLAPVGEYAKLIDPP